MDLSGVRARRTKSLFRPWNSYLAKKGLVDAAPKAREYDLSRQRAAKGDIPHHAPVVRLTCALLDTYEGINASYYRKKAGNSLYQPSNGLDESHQAPVAAVTASNQPCGSTNLLRKSFVQTSSNASSTKKKRKNKTESSPLSVQYCDENFDYIVRTGETFNNRYMLEKVIGRGSFGQVVRAYDTRDNTHVAIKIIKNNSLYVEQALSEVRMTSYLNRIDPEDAHSIMRLRDKFIFRGHQCLVLELLSFSLYDLLRSTEFYGVSLNLVRKFCKQILNCLAFLSRCDVNIAHCDLKPENVLLRHPQRSAIKVVDFGASCHVSESMFTYVQSRFYRAPEVILGLPYGTQVDVWSLGCMLVELHTGYPVFAGKDEGHQMAIIVERLGLPPEHMLRQGKKTALFFDRNADTGEWSLKSSVWPDNMQVPAGSKPINAFVEYHTETANGRRKRMSGGHSEVDYEIFLSLVHKMLRYDPGERITADEALRDSFVRGSLTRSGRESPPPLPSMEGVGDSVVKDQEVDSGRKAPVQRMMKHVEVTTVDGVHSDASVGDLAEISAEIGGKLRLSKSEPAFEPLPKKTFVFKTSDWAEGVGIEPPPWRSGGHAGDEDEMLGCRLKRHQEVRRKLGAAGGGCHLARDGTNGLGECSRYGLSRYGWNRGSQEQVGFGAQEQIGFGAREQIGYGRRAEGARLLGHIGGRELPLNVATPRGHGNTLLLFIDRF